MKQIDAQKKKDATGAVVRLRDASGFFFNEASLISQEAALK